MRFGRLRRTVQQGRGAVTLPGVQFMLVDRFSGTLAAGAVNGRTSDNGHTMSVTDTESKLSVGSGLLSFSGGKASPAYGDPGAVYSSAFARGSGLVCTMTQFNIASGVAAPLGFMTAATTGLFSETGLVFSSGNIRRYSAKLGGFQTIGAYSTATAYHCALGIDGASAFYFIKGGAFTSWTKLHEEALAAGSNVYVATGNYSGVCTIGSLALARVVDLGELADRSDLSWLDRYLI